MRNQLVSRIYDLANDGIPKIWPAKERRELPLFQWSRDWTELFGSRMELRKRLRELNDGATATSVAKSAN